MTEAKTVTPTPPPQIKAEEARTIPDGDHVGEIVLHSYEERGDPAFKYLDVHVKDSESGVTIKVGYPCERVTPENDLGRLLRLFGAEVVPGEDVDFSVLKGQVRFTTETEKNRNGRFARVIRDTLRPMA
jgi:hypothetical protein